MATADPAAATGREDNGEPLNVTRNDEHPDRLIAAAWSSLQSGWTLRKTASPGVSSTEAKIGSQARSENSTTASTSEPEPSDLRLSRRAAGAEIEALREGINVAAMRRVERVASGLRQQLHLRRLAWNVAIKDRAHCGERAGRINPVDAAFHSIEPLAPIVEPHGVNVDLMSVGVGQLKAQWCCAMNTHVTDQRQAVPVPSHAPNVRMNLRNHAGSRLREAAARMVACVSR